jgi:integrase
VQQFLERWLSDVVAQRCRPTTYEMYRHSVQRMTKHIGQIQLRTLGPQHVQAMLKQLGQEGYAPATVDRARDVLINALNQAVEWQLMPRNVARLTSPPRVESYAPHVLTPGEAQRLLQAAQEDRLAALWRVALSLGLRHGEVLGLRWCDVDLDRGTLWIAVNLQRINGALVLVKPKKQENLRTLALPASLIAALRQHKGRQLQEKLVAGARWHDHGLVFCTRIGTPISPRNLLRSLQMLLDRAHLPHMRFHDLRHSCATLLLAQGVPVKVVQEILGHTDPHVTLGIYQHVVMEDRRQAATIMDGLLSESHEDTRST